MFFLDLNRIISRAPCQVIHSDIYVKITPRDFAEQLGGKQATQERAQVYKDGLAQQYHVPCKTAPGVNVERAYGGSRDFTPVSTGGAACYKGIIVWNQRLLALIYKREVGNRS